MTPLYPRWGYLDKFAVNEYMAKALLVTIGLWLLGQAGFLGWHALRPEMVRLRPFVGPPIRDVVIIGAYNPPVPPPVVERPRPKPRAKVSTMAGGRVELVVDPVGIDNWDAQGVAGGTGTEADPGISLDASGPITDIMTFPRAEDWVAFEQGPELISIRPTEYPEIAREAGIEGKVFVRVLVGADGFVQAAEILEGVLGLDEAALAAARTAVFKPAEQQGRAVATWMVIPIEFALRDR